ncbi:ABC transporter ATP-binding protein [Paraburkholderia kirstenboschensis]|uniref:ABC transporter ATP-binding protein n=1 Tax=Paraburkholderia kirstenboschensis TaxID=1245436 RepID=A0ABZ0EF35_9BURK|nr:ABC transporter ATP-binding protein [Paraburkholderia kirstenboschensis]WOD15525.1 ABC transporter ATP-binding protein [Paraburkholderia kirstenboschensis]
MKKDLPLPRPLVDIRGLSIRFLHANEGRPLVRGVDLTIRAGECVALVGESGSGKSLTARSLIGLAGQGARIDAQRFEIDGRSALGFGERDWRALRGAFAGLVMQDALVSLDPLRTVGAEIGEAVGLHAKLRSRAGRAARVREVMSDVGIPEPGRRADQYAHELSGGLRQRALIASAIAAGPALVIADEPTTALDVTVQAQILAVLAARLREGVGVLLISHDLAVVADIADRVLVMHEGEVVDSGTTESVLNNPSHAYTRQLLAAQPSALSRGHKLSSARMVPDVDRLSGRGELSIVREPLPLRATRSDQVVLQAAAIGKRYAKRGAGRANRNDTFTALDDVSFSVHRGEVVGIVGESGSGKSTCANVVLGLVTPSTGDVTFLGTHWNGANVNESSRRALRPRLQYIPQDPLSSFDPRHTVQQLLQEGLFSTRLEKRALLDRSVELLEQVGLDATYLGRRPATLSGGQRQRVAIARAIAPEPALIVCDEPVSALDVYVQAQVLDLLAALQSRLDMSLLFISHDLDVVRHVSDRVLVFSNGRVVEAGDAQGVFDSPEHAYTRELMAASPSLRRARCAAAAARVVESATG